MSGLDGHADRLDRQLIDELRSARRRLEGATPLAMKVTLEELDALFRAVDERDELRRQTVGDWEPDFPPVRVVPPATTGAEAIGREERETPRSDA